MKDSSHTFKEHEVCGNLSKGNKNKMV